MRNTRSCAPGVPAPNTAARASLRATCAGMEAIDHAPQPLSLPASRASRPGGAL
jgi:hypothetical protein